jgi:hypothetical protein
MEAERAASRSLTGSARLENCVEYGLHKRQINKSSGIAESIRRGTSTCLDEQLH